MKVIVIINEGIVTGVLSEDDVDVEILDINKDYEDYENLRDYEDKLYSDSRLGEKPFTVTRFGGDKEYDE